MMKVAIVYCAAISLQLILLLSPIVCSADQPDGESPELLADACQSVNILMAHNSNTGIQILLTSTTPSKMNNSVMDIPNHYLPPECDANNDRCGILHFEHNGCSYYIIPLIRSFMMLSRSVDYTDHAEETQQFVVNVSEECNPIRVFHTKGNHLVVACVDLQARPRGILYYLNYDFIPSSVGSGSIVRNTEPPTKSETIYSPATVSEIIHVQGQLRCTGSQIDNLYFIDDAYVLGFPTSDMFDPEFRLSHRALQGCTGYQSFEYYGNDSLIIRCSNDQVALYDSCAGRFTYPPHDHIPYPCMNWSTIAYRNGSKLTLDRGGEHATLQLPFDDLSYGKCVQGVNHPIFIASSADGSIFIAPFDGGNVTKITSGNYSNSDTSWPRRPVFSENEQVFGVFELTTGSLVIVNMTEGCTDNPMIAQIPIPFIPSLVLVSLGKGTYACNCSLTTVETIEPPSTTQQTESTSIMETMQTESTTATALTEFTTTATYPTKSTTDNISSMALTDSSTNTFQSDDLNARPIPKPTNTGALVGIILSSVVPVVTVAVTAIIIVCLCMYHRFYHVKRKENYDPNVRPERESNAPTVGDLTLNQYSPEGLESGRTTSTSCSESNEALSSTSSGSVQTISMCHAESGLGGETCVLAGDYPLNPTQFNAETVHGQYQSRTSDKNRKDDMNVKIELFV